MVWVWNHKLLSQAVHFFISIFSNGSFFFFVCGTLVVVSNTSSTHHWKFSHQTQHHGGLVFSHLLTRMAKSCYSYPRQRVAQNCMSRSLVISCESWNLNELSAATHLLLRLETGRNEVLWRIKLGRQISLRASKDTDEVAWETDPLVKCYTSIQLCFYPITHRKSLEDSEDLSS